MSKTRAHRKRLDQRSTHAVSPCRRHRRVAMGRTPIGTCGGAPCNDCAESGVSLCCKVASVEPRYPHTRATWPPAIRASTWRFPACRSRGPANSHQRVISPPQQMRKVIASRISTIPRLSRERACWDCQLSTPRLVVYGRCAGTIWPVQKCLSSEHSYRSRAQGVDRSCASITCMSLQPGSRPVSCG